MSTIVPVFNDGKAVHPLVNDSMIVHNSGELQPGDLVYSEWYGQGGGYDDCNRYRVALVTGIFTNPSGEVFVTFSGNIFDCNNEFKHLKAEYNALSNGCFSRGMGVPMAVDVYSQYWKVGHSKPLLAAQNRKSWSPDPRDPHYSVG